MKKKIDKSINELKDYSKKIYLKGKRISIYTVFKIFKSKLIEDEIFERSLAVAYSFTLATFPLIIFLFTLIPYINTWVPEIDSIKILTFLEGVIVCFRQLYLRRYLLKGFMHFICRQWAIENIKPNRFNIINYFC